MYDIIVKNFNTFDDGNKLIPVLNTFITCGLFLLIEDQKNLVFFIYIFLSMLTIINTKNLLYIFFSSIWISHKLYFELGSIIIRLSDIMILFIFISWLINSLFKKSLILDKPKKNDYVIIGLTFFCIFSLFTSLNKVSTVIEIIQILQLIFLFYLIKTITDPGVDIKYFMKITTYFGLVNAFWVYSSVLKNGIGDRYIGILDILPIELPYSLAFLYIYFIFERKNSQKIIYFFLILFLLLALIFSMSRGSIIIAFVMFVTINLCFFKGSENFFKLIYVFIFAALISISLISSNNTMSDRFGSIFKGGENRNMRLYNWYSSYLILKEYPFTGVGLGNDKEYLKSFLPESSPEIVKKFGGDSPHNEILHFGIQLGVLGILFSIYFYFSLVNKSFWLLKKNKHYDPKIMIALFSTTLGLSVFSIANDTFLAGQGAFVIILLAFIDKIYDDNFVIIKTLK